MVSWEALMGKMEAMAIRGAELCLHSASQTFVGEVTPPFLFPSAEAAASCVCFGLRGAGKAAGTTSGTLKATVSG